MLFHVDEGCTVKASVATFSGPAGTSVYMGTHPVRAISVTVASRMRSFISTSRSLSQSETDHAGVLRVGLHGQVLIQGLAALGGLAQLEQGITLPAPGFGRCVGQRDSGAVGLGGLRVVAGGIAHAVDLAFVESQQP